MKHNLVLVLTLFSCESSTARPEPQPEQPATLGERQANAVRAMGLRNPKPHGSALFSCSDSDTILQSEGFEATNMAGERVTGTVCCGWLKGCTVRFE
jgi:hypothetical protein